MMNKLIMILLGAALAATAVAADAIAEDASVYGRLDLAKFSKPKVINAKPIVIEASAKPASVKPIYLHVPPGQEWHWHSLCKIYDACAVPVYFVTENWFVNVYLPAVGAQDGREQRYRMEASRERGTERDVHDVHGEE